MKISILNLRDIQIMSDFIYTLFKNIWTCQIFGLKMKDVEPMSDPWESHTARPFSWCQDKRGRGLSPLEARLTCITSQDGVLPRDKVAVQIRWLCTDPRRKHGKTKGHDTCSSWLCYWIVTFHASAVFIRNHY